MGIVNRKAVREPALYVREDQENQGLCKVVGDRMSNLVPLYLKHTIRDLN